MKTDPTESKYRHANRASKGWRIALAIGALAWLSCTAPQACADTDGMLESGALIYNEGRLASGAPLTGTRDGHEPAVGAAAACASCHRPSGMGQVEGDEQVPPIAGNFLFARRGTQGIVTMDPRVSKLFNQAHEPYSDATLARAIRDGINSEGRPMSVLMPRYALTDGELQGLSAYLRQLSKDWSPGVSATRIRLATVITPEVDARRRKIFVDMMRTIVLQKNASTVVADPKKNRHHMVSAAELIHGTERNWDLQIWELQGPPETWVAQLEERYRANPVFALVSGLSDDSWQPVQDFCEATRVPCWFPSGEAGGAAPAKYTMYFSHGVQLEAALLGRRLAAQEIRPKRVVQAHHADALGRIASKAMSDAIAGSGIEVADREISGGPGLVDAVKKVSSAIASDEVLVLWLRADELEALAGIAPPAVETYFSGRLVKGESAPIPAAWRARAHLVYPYELPAKRAKNLDFFHAWLNLRKIPLIDEPMQSEVFFAMNFLTDTLSEMLDNVYRDYLLERAEQMLGKREGAKSEQETRDRVALGAEGDLLRRRGPMTMDESTRIGLSNRTELAAKSQGTTLYAHLSLGAGQRHASKSGYIVRFTGENGTELTAETPLITP